MTRYRGTVDGRQRGEYKSVQLRALFWSEELAKMWGTKTGKTWPSVPFDDLDRYLRHAGAFLHRDGRRIGDDCSSFGTYHYGGATVHVQYHIREFKPGEYDGYVYVDVVSNDAVDDVIERLCRRFPRLKRKDSADEAASAGTQPPWPGTS